VPTCSECQMRIKRGHSFFMGVICKDDGVVLSAPLCSKCAYKIPRSQCTSLKRLAPGRIAICYGIHTEPIEDFDQTKPMFGITRRQAEEYLPKFSDTVRLEFVR